MTHLRPVGLRAWEIAAVLNVVALGRWLVDAGSTWAVGAALLAIAALSLAAAARRAVGVVLSAVGILASASAIATSWRVSRVENRWLEVREALSVREEEVAATVHEAVSLVQDLADDGAAVSESSRSEALLQLAGLVDHRGPGGPETGVVVLDEDGEPWAWAGSFRIPPGGGLGDLYARITPFYVVLEAWSSSARAAAVAQVVLAADSVVPNRDRTVASLFRDRTGATLEFYAPRLAPNTPDVFDACLPSCDAQGVIPDTLFSVLAVPPEQGARRFQLLMGGSRGVSLAALVMFLLAIVLGGRSLRIVAAFGAAAFLLFTPAPQSLGLATLFSSDTYYWDVLGPFSRSAGALICTSAVAVIVAVLVWRRGHSVTVVTLVTSGLMIIAAPFALRSVARGITPPASGADLGMWLTWELTVALASAAFVLLAAALLRRLNPGRSRPWIIWGAAGWAIAVAVLGLFTWEPYVAWPEWYAFLWAPALVLAVQPVPRVRMVPVVAVVAGSAAALLTWGAAVEGRLELAQQDASGLGDQRDSSVIGSLDRLSTEIEADIFPLTEAELYSRWLRSSLASDEYPAALASWSADGTLLARLDLAQVDLSSALLQAFAAGASEAGQSLVEEIQRRPGVHYVLSVPYPDGAVVSVGVGPRSRLVAPTRVARFLSRGPPTAAPFEMSLSEPGPASQGPERLQWDRDGWTVRGEQRLDLPGGTTHLHVKVLLLGGPQLLVRGTLVLVLNVAVVALLWLAGELVLGGVSVPPGFQRLLSPASYRARLAIALAIFFVVPTVGFTIWSMGRLDSGANRDRDLVIRKTLRDAAGSVRELAGMRPVNVSERLADLSQRVDAELLVYEGGELTHSSASVLAQLGIVDRFVDLSVFRRVVLSDELEFIGDAAVGAGSARVAYRTLGDFEGKSRVLAVPAVKSGSVLGGGQEDIVFALLLATLLGVAAALSLAALASRSLAKPVQALKAAAAAVGRGDTVGGFEASVPPEFVPVVDAFDRMERDVSEHRAKLEAALALTSAVLENVATGVVALDPELRVTTANPRARGLFGVPLELGVALDELASREWGDLCQWVKDFLNGDAETGAHEFTVGSRRIHARVAVLEVMGRGCVLALDDASELARAERILAWGEMARQVAHEIKNPLTPVRLGVQHLLRAHSDARGDFDDTLARTAKQILAEIERLDSIARAFSRFGTPPPESGSLVEVDISEVAREAADLYAIGSGTRVTVDAEGPVFGLVRRDELKEVLINLVENSRNAGATEVRTAIRGGHGKRPSVEVSDDGRGIPPGDIPRIFEPQFSTTTSGTGLGLAICKRLVESWGGEISVTSELGRGTAVVFTLGQQPAAGS